jgi:hypothetical protein
LEDLSELLGVEVSSGSAKGTSLFRIRINSMDGHDDTLSLFSSANDLSSVASAECH